MPLGTYTWTVPIATGIASEMFMAGSGRRFELGAVIYELGHLGINNEWIWI